MVDAAQPLLQRVGYSRFHIFGIGPAPDGADSDLVEFEIGEKLYVKLLQGYAAREQHHHHQQVGGDAVACEYSQQANCHRLAP